MEHLTPRFGYADTPHGQVHYAEAGQGDPLILLPGSARSYRQFLPLLGSLSPHFRVIAIDTLGYGASAPFPAGGSIRTLAEGVVGVLDALGIAAAHVFGIHTGHKVTASLAADWPDDLIRLQRHLGKQAGTVSHAVVDCRQHDGVVPQPGDMFRRRWLLQRHLVRHGRLADQIADLNGVHTAGVVERWVEVVNGELVRTGCVDD